MKLDQKTSPKTDQARSDGESGNRLARAQFLPGRKGVATRTSHTHTSGGAGTPGRGSAAGRAADALGTRGK